jgi:hypothetical protein
VFALRANPTFQTELVLNVTHQNIGTIKTKHVKDALIRSFMTRKSNNVFALSTSHISLKTDVFHATCHIIGTAMSVNVYRVLLLLSTIIKQEDVFVLQKDLIWSMANVSLVRYQITGTRQLTIVKYALKLSNMIHTKEAVYAQS